MMEHIDVVTTLEELIRIPSVNPMGCAADGAPYFEQRLTDYLQQFFAQLGVPWHRQPVAPQRDNILARLDGSRDDGTLVFEVHQDTVPVDGMTIDPWEPSIRNGRLYGRGACDDKGPMACMLTAFARLARQRPPGMPTVIMACTVNEENGFSGAHELAQLWARGDDPLVDQLPTAMIVAEPTALDVVMAHKGVVRWRCHSVGRAAHSSCPEQGENAIYQMGHMITACEQYGDLLARVAPHALLGRPTINLGTIRGGICVNAVPDRCTVELDRRLLPDEDPQEARRAATDWFTAHLPNRIAARLQHDAPFLVSHGLSELATKDLARRVQTALGALGLAPTCIGVPYATDAPSFARLGIPTVVFGPGSIDQAHTADEWISLEALHKGVEAYYLLAATGMAD